MHASGILETVRSSRRGIGDVGLSVLPSAIGMGAALGTSILLARGLGPAGMGRYALVTSVSVLLVSFTDLGLSATAIRYASRAAAAGDAAAEIGILRWALRVRMLLAAAGAALAFVLAPYVAGKAWNDPSLSPLLRLALLIGLLTPLATFPSTVFQARRRFGWNAVAVAAQPLLGFVAVVLLQIYGVWTVEAAVTAAVAAVIVGGLLVLPALPGDLFRQHATFSLKPPAAGGEASGEFALLNFMASVVVSVTERADVWILGAFLTQGEVGLYAAAARFTLPLMRVLTGVNTVLWPRAGAARTEGETRKLLGKTLLLGLGLAGGAAVYAASVPWLVPLFFGERYQGSRFLAMLLCARWALALLASPLSVVGYNLGLIKRYLAMNVVQLVAVVSVLLIFIPIIGAYAGAAALLLNEVIALTVVCWLVLRRPARAG